MEGFQKFRLLDAALIIGSILTFIADQATGSVISLKGYRKEIPLILRDTTNTVKLWYLNTSHGTRASNPRNEELPPSTIVFPSKRVVIKIHGDYYCICQGVKFWSRKDLAQQKGAQILPDSVVNFECVLARQSIKFVPTLLRLLLVVAGYHSRVANMGP